MKILVLAPQPFFEQRGTPIAVRELLAVLSQQGYSLDVLTYHQGQNISLPDCRIHRLPRLPGIRDIRPGLTSKKLICDAVMVFKLIRMLRRQQWDIIHAVEESVFMALAAKLLFGVPYVYDMDSSLPNQIVEKLGVLVPCRWLFRLFERLAIRHSVGVITVCRSLEEIATAHGPRVPVVRVEDTSLLTIVDPRPKLEEEVFSADGLLIMYVGNLEKYQGIDLLLDAFVHVYHRNPHARLVVVGGNDREVESYGLRVSRYEVADRCFFLGPRPVEHLAEYLSAADILVSPRISGNNTPMKVYSYLASGTPVVATRLTTHTQVLTDDVAVLVDPDPLSMAHGIETLLENPSFAKQLGREAQEVVRRVYSSEVLRGKLTMFYEEISESIVKPSIETSMRR